MESVSFIDSHTAGEPTRVILAGGPDLGTGPLSDRLAMFESEFDEFRRSTILEPRGYDALVGALLCEPYSPDCAAGVIFFNNRGFLGMCGHGTIGLAVTLAHLGRIELGKFLLDTPVGVVEVDLQTPNRVAIQNVPAYRHLRKAEVRIPELGTLIGDVAWGGNWFFLVEDSPLPLTTDQIPALSALTRKILLELEDQGITGEHGTPIDHVEFFGPPTNGTAQSRNFVMCPGGEYDRSPCGTGTSAKLACLAADKKLGPGQQWVQEGILGTSFAGSYQQLADGKIAPTIVGDAYVTTEGILHAQQDDPFRHGIQLDIAL